ncbi:hypothetical protein [Ferruginibacter sp. SUN106]|uniref:hypothetical protein n=1 Tax=Ferruginibacter sp. SUN106 TaxID=2978348 RepID=UPI003D3656E3
MIVQISFAQNENLGEIYSIGIKFRLDQLSWKKVFVADTVTDNEFSMSTRRCTKLFKKFLFEDNSVVTTDNLDSMNSSLKDIFNPYKNIRLINMEEKSKILSNHSNEGWIHFYKNYPGYAGIIYLSPVYFNQQHSKAIYQLSLARQACGNGSNSLIFLAKDKNGKWFKTMPGK